MIVVTNFKFCWVFGRKGTNLSINNVYRITNLTEVLQKLIWKITCEYYYTSLDIHEVSCLSSYTQTYSLDLAWITANKTANLSPVISENVFNYIFTENVSNSEHKQIVDLQTKQKMCFQNEFLKCVFYHNIEVLVCSFTFNLSPLKSVVIWLVYTGCNVQKMWFLKKLFCQCGWINEQIFLSQKWYFKENSESKFFGVNEVWVQVGPILLRCMITENICEWYDCIRYFHIQRNSFILRSGSS